MKPLSWKSRKLGFSIICIAALAAVAVAAAKFPAMIGLYPVFVGGVTAVAGLYLSSNIASQHVDSKLQQGLAAPKE